ncbi:MAG TPA: hypothetical protein VLM19_05155, partial [Nitrospiraceae bacterium]|nr:hypothetical protein [Nitrospiraceae bacterium]
MKNKEPDPEQDRALVFWGLSGLFGLSRDKTDWIDKTDLLLSLQFVLHHVLALRHAIGYILGVGEID